MNSIIATVPIRPIFWRKKGQSRTKAFGLVIERTALQSEGARNWELGRLFRCIERTKDSGKDKEIFNHWRRLVFDQNAEGGVAGMYGMCTIAQGRPNLEEALDKLCKIKDPSPDLMCQIGLMFIHAGSPNRSSNN